MLVPVDGTVQPTGVLKSRQLQSGKTPGVGLAKRQDAENSTSSAPSLVSATPLESQSISLPATPVYNVSPVATTSIEEIESMGDPPFRRSNLASVVALNIPALINLKTEPGPLGYKVFAEGVRQGLAHSKRELEHFLPRDVDSDDGMEVVERRGRRYDCMRKYGSNAMR
ncbi:hypothetical protein MMC26_005248 [Xylographa opegraphella]|nr:hypothetical protein [Xylographa opegraphella]